MVNTAFNSEEEEERAALIEQLERRDLIRQLEARDEQRAQAQAPPPTDIGVPDSTTRDKFGAATQGFSLNLGDEITAGLVSTAGSMFGDDDMTWGERYEDVLGAENARLDAYREAHPVESMAFEVAGGLATPMGPLGAIKSAATVAKNQGRIRKAVDFARRGTGRGMAEGAIAGAGANEEDRLGGALTGAKWGAALPAALNVGVKAPGKRLVNMLNLDEKLVDAAGRFKPWHLAKREGDSRWGDFLRNRVGATWGGGGKLRRQARPWMDEAGEAVEGSQLKLSMAREAATQASKTAQREASEASLRLGDEASTRQLGMKRETEDLIDEVKRKSAQEDVAAKIDTEDLVKKTKREAREVGERADAGLDADDANFRQTARERGLPNNMKDGDRAAIMGIDSDQEAAEAITGWWVNNAFSMIKKRTKKFDLPVSVQGRLKEMLRRDPDLAMKVGDVDKTVGELVEKMVGNNRKMSGKELMSLRNVFAGASNKTSKAYDGTKLRAVADEFDDFIVEQLGGVGSDAAADYMDHLARYSSRVNYKKAVGSAYLNGGRFTPKQYLTSAGKGSRRDYGNLDLQEEAGELYGRRGLEKAGKQARKEGALEATADIQREAGEAGRNRAVTAADEASTIRRGNEDEGLRLKRSVARRQQQLNQGKINDPNVRAAKDVVKTEQGGLREARKAQKELKSRASPEKTPILSQLAATAIFGSPAAAAGLGAGAVGAVPTGFVTSSILASKPIQKFMAGQASWQEGIKTLAANPKTRALANQIRRALAREEAARHSRSQ